jgi:hypothetical protein
MPPTAQPRERLADAAAHATFHGARTGEPVEPRTIEWLRVAGGRYRVVDVCEACGQRAPMTTRWTCLSCELGTKGGLRER